MVCGLSPPVFGRSVALAAVTRVTTFSPFFSAPTRLLESQWANLRSKKNQEKKLAVTIFSFPPDKGNVGTAAYLDVFGSIHTVLSKLRKEVRQSVTGL